MNNDEFNQYDAERFHGQVAEQLGITAAPRPERLNSTPPGIILVITEDLK